MRPLERAHGTGLPFLFSQLDDEIMATPNIHKPIPPPLEVLNVDDTLSSHVSRITKFSYVYQGPSIMFGKDLLQPQTPGKRTMVANIIQARTNTAPRVDTGAAQTG